MRKTTLIIELILTTALLTGCNTHEHTFSDKWENNESCHWHPATCEHKDLTKDLASHVDSNEDGYCDVCNYRLDNEKYYVVVFVDGTKLLYDPIIVGENETIYRPDDPLKIGHSFNGWYDNPTFLGDTYNFDLPVTENMTLYAKFDVCDYKITYVNAENIIHNDPDGYTFGIGVESFDEAAHDSEGIDKFYGWYFDEEFTKPATTISKDSTGDITLYAKRSEIFTIEYQNWPEDIDNPNPLEYTALEEVIFNSEPIEEYPGFSSIGFKEDKNIIKGIPLGTTGNKVINVTYNLTNTKVTFNPNGGLLIPDQSYIYVDFGEDLWVKKVALPLVESNQFKNIYDQTFLPVPTKEGYVFRGYFLDKNFGTKISETENNILQSGATIYAKWEEIPEGYDGSLYLDKVTYTANLEKNQYSVSKTFKYVVPYYIRNVYMYFCFEAPSCHDGTITEHEVRITGTRYDDSGEQQYSGFIFSDDRDKRLIQFLEDRNFEEYKSIEIYQKFTRIEGFDESNTRIFFAFSTGETTPFKSGLIAVEKTSSVYEENYQYWELPGIKAEREGYLFAGWFDSEGNRVDFKDRWMYLEEEMKVTASWLPK